MVDLNSETSFIVFLSTRYTGRITIQTHEILEDVIANPGLLVNRTNSGDSQSKQLRNTRIKVFKFGLLLYTSA